MATIEKRVSSTGEITYKVTVRFKGHAPAGLAKAKRSGAGLAVTIRNIVTLVKPLLPRGLVQGVALVFRKLGV